MTSSYEGLSLSGFWHFSKHIQKGSLSSVYILIGSLYLLPHRQTILPIYPSLLVAYDTLTIWLISHFWYWFMRSLRVRCIRRRSILDILRLLRWHCLRSTQLLSLSIFHSLLCLVSYFTSIIPIQCPYISLSAPPIFFMVALSPFTISYDFLTHIDWVDCLHLQAG